MRKKLITVLMTALLTCSVNLWSAGAPVFDVENWLYSILQYSQQAEDIARKIQDVANETKRWEQAYEALTSGDILSAISGVTSMVEMSRNYYNAANKAQEIDHNLTDISRALSDVDAHRDDPDYWLNLVQQIHEASTTLNDVEKEHRQQVTTDLQTETDTLHENSQNHLDFATAESQTKQMGTLISATTDLSMQQLTQKAQDFTTQTLDNSKQRAAELEEEALSRYYEAQINSAILHVAEEFASQGTPQTAIPDNPFEGVR